MWCRMLRCLGNKKNYIVAFEEDKALFKVEIEGHTIKNFKEALESFIVAHGVCNMSVDVPMDVTNIPLFKKKEEANPEVMPKIDDTQWDSPNQSERGASITQIVLHNTACSYQTAIDWLCNPQAQASCHLIIGRDAKTACIVPFSKKAWHAGNGRVNSNSIGIEIEATANQRGLTTIQEKKLIEWIRWFMKKYNIKKESIGIHRWYSSTDCPILIWATDKEFLDWRNKKF